MSKLSKNKSYPLYFVLGLFVVWILTYVCFSFVFMEFNVLNWLESERIKYLVSLFGCTIFYLFVLLITHASTEDY